MKKFTIKSLAEDDRPREKLISKGVSVLSNTELIAILIGSGNKHENAVDLAKRILNSVDDNVTNLSRLSLKNLMNFKGIGEAKAISILTALELGKRRQIESTNTKSTIKSSLDAYEILKPFLEDLNHEEFWALFLNNSNKVIAKYQLSKGGLTSTIVDVRLLYKKALEQGSVGIIVSHNHPSGKLFPSNADKVLTQKIKEAGKTLDIKLLDHIIITEKAYFSFADERIL